MNLKKSFIYKADASKGKHDELPCSAQIVNENQIQLCFNIPRKKPQDHYLELDAEDLRNILQEYSATVSGAAVLFAECVTIAVAADAARIKQS